MGVDIVANKKDIFELLEENTLLEKKYEFVSKQNKDLQTEIDRLNEVINNLKTEKAELEKVSEKSKQEFREIIQYLNNTFELDYVLNDKLEIQELEF